MTSIVHIAGPDIQVNDQLRQRCAWCGAVLLDYNLTRSAVPEGQDPRPGTWPVGELLEVDGGASWVRRHTDGEPLPSNACALTDPETTDPGQPTTEQIWNYLQNNPQHFRVLIQRDMRARPAWWSAHLAKEARIAGSTWTHLGGRS